MIDWVFYVYRRGHVIYIYVYYIYICIYIYMYIYIHNMYHYTTSNIYIYIHNGVYDNAGVSKKGIYIVFFFNISK